MSTDRELAQAEVAVIYSAESRLRRPRAFLRTGLRDLRESRPTARRFFLRGLTQRYRYSSLGLIWAFVPSLVTALVLVASQKTRLIGGGHGQVPVAFYGVFGLAMAQTFVEGLNVQRMLFTTHQHLLRRSNIAIEGLIAAGVIDVAFSALIRIVIVVVAFFFFGVHPALTFPLAILGLLGTILISQGIGLLFAPMSSLKRDIDNIMMFLPWILFAITPVFVPSQPQSLIGKIHHWNPLAAVFDSSRALAYGAPGTPWPAVLSVPVGLGLLALGWVVCRLWRPYVVERLLV